MRKARVDVTRESMQGTRQVGKENIGYIRTNTSNASNFPHSLHKFACTPFRKKLMGQSKETKQKPKELKKL